MILTEADSQDRWFYLNFLLQASMFLQYSLPRLSESFNMWLLPYLTPYSVPIIHISLTGSVYSVVAVALERFVTVCFPFTQCSMCNGLGMGISLGTKLLFRFSLWKKILQFYHCVQETFRIFTNASALK